MILCCLNIENPLDVVNCFSYIRGVLSYSLFLPGISKHLMIFSVLAEMMILLLCFLENH